MKSFDKLFKEEANFEINMKCENGKCFAKVDFLKKKLKMQ